MQINYHMKKVFLFFLVVSSLMGRAQQSDSAWIVNNYIKKEFMVPMRDGVKLFTSVYIPRDNNEKHPILIIRTPYSCAPYGEDKFASYWTSPRKAFLKEN